MSGSETPAVDDAGERVDERHRAFARLFPAARSQRPLVTTRPPLGVVAARSWHRVSVALLAAGIAILGEIFLLSAPTSMLGFGWAPFLLGIALTLAGMFGFAWSTYELRPRTRAARTTWAEWARERGLVEVTPGTLQLRGGHQRRAIGGALLHVEPARRFTPTYRATLGGGRKPVVAHVGTMFVHGPWGTVTNLQFGCVAAVVNLPTSIAERLPASTLDRFVRGERPWRGRAATKLRQLRLESSAFDDACDLRVDAGSDDLEWYRLLDPRLLSDLAHEWPVSWQQHGSTLVVYMPAPALTLDEIQLDTLCQATAAIARAFADAGTTNERISDEVRERAAQRRALHRRRHRIQALASWLAVLGVLAVPIYVVTTLDARRDAARAAEVRERNDESQRRFERETDRADTQYAVRRVARIVNDCVDRCTTIPADARHDLTAGDAVTDEQVNDVRIERSGASVRVSGTSRSGVTFTLSWTGDLLDGGRYTCAPEGPTCEDGSWGGENG